jgi:hypothetical protein
MVGLAKRNCFQLCQTLCLPKWSCEIELKVGNHALALTTTLDSSQTLLRNQGGEATKHLAGHWYSALEGKVVQFHFDAIVLGPKVVAWQVDGLDLVPPHVYHLSPDLLTKKFSTGWAWDTQITAHGLGKSR